VNIRSFNFTEEDYVAVTDIWNRIYPQYPLSVSEVKKEDEARPDKVNWKRYVLELGDVPIGYSMFFNSEEAFHPQEFVVSHYVLPEHHAKGYGRALYEHMIHALKPYNPKLLKAWSREDFTRQTRFLKDRGFEESMRAFQSLLNLETFDLSLYKGLQSRLEFQNIELKSFAELKADPERKRKIYELHTTLDRDVPMVGEYTKPSFDRFAEVHWEHERFLADGFVVAVHKAEYVGMSELYRSEADDNLHTGLTAVLSSYRRQGIALALKLQTIAFARSFGAPQISTWNALNNRPMLAINEKLGFVKQPAHIDFVKVLA